MDARAVTALLALLLVFWTGAALAEHSGTQLPEVPRHLSLLQEPNVLTNPPPNRAYLVGGGDAPCGRYPYMVSLRDRVNSHICGGILVHRKWVLTAAHCVDPDDIASAGQTPIVVIGACHVNDEVNENGKVETLSSKQTFSHENWTGDVRDGYDIALIKLTQKSKHIPALLPTQEHGVGSGQTFVALGWGATSDEARAERLQQANSIEFITRDVCNQEVFWNGTVKDSMLCAFSFRVHQNVCKGDSGGPLLQVFAPQGNVSAGKPDLDVVTGITSFVEDVGCVDTMLPSVFTEVASFRGWIDARMRLSENSTRSHSFGDLMPLLSCST